MTQFCAYFEGAYLYDGCGPTSTAASAAADYLSRRAVGIEACDNPPQYWPGKSNNNLMLFMICKMCTAVCV